MATASALRKKTRYEYIEDNERWGDFIASLEKRGVTVRWLWQAKSSPSLKHPNIHGVVFCGESVREDLGVAIVVDYCVGHLIGNTLGYALHFEAGHTIDGDVEAICKPQ